MSHISLDLKTKVPLRARLARSWPLWVVVALILCAIGWWTGTTVERLAAEQLSQQLQVILNVDVEALKEWARTQRVEAEVIAAQPQVIEAVVELTKLAGGTGMAKEELLSSEPLIRLREVLEPRYRAHGFEDFVVIDPTGLTLAALLDGPVGTRSISERSDFVRQALAGRSLVSRPFPSAVDLPDENGENWRPNRPTMFVATPVNDTEGRTVAVFGLRIKPEVDFSRILRIARLGESGETYAFDEKGVILSQSRFEEQLRDIGLLPRDPEVGAILNVQVRDPGGSLVDGFKPSVERNAQPLTRAAASAIAGNTAVDVEGYRDYRGVGVVGAWSWVDEAKIGFVTEVDYDEAYRSLRLLRTVFWLLFGFLAVTAVGVLLSSEMIGKLRAKVSTAEHKMMQLGTYTLEEKLGEGGMGEVYRASHSMLRRPTAVKLLTPGRSNEEMIARFEREVQMTSQLSHPNTISIFDYGRTPDGVFYYAMEYLDGINLEDLVGRFGPLPASRVKKLLFQMSASLAEAHAIGLIHRDIKPANIFLCNRGGLYDFVKVLDFGLVRHYGDEEKQMAALTQVGMTTGTPAYMAPEMILGKEVGPGVDVYATGCIGYWLLTGKQVFEGENAMALAMAHTKEKVVPPSEVSEAPIPECLENLIMKCLSKKAADRPRDARELVTELEGCVFEPAWSQEMAMEWWSENLPGRETIKV